MTARRQGIDIRKTNTRLTDIICKVCHLGKIFERVLEFCETDSLNKWSEAEYHCNVCGVKYEFLPTQKLMPDKSTDSIIQVRPGLYQAQKSNSIFREIK